MDALEVQVVTRLLRDSASSLAALPQDDPVTWRAVDDGVGGPSTAAVQRAGDVLGRLATSAESDRALIVAALRTAALSAERADTTDGTDSTLAMEAC